ncbi:MAG TPA: filamentous hemagglutinin N-terminal domain-containing protein [Marinospirillum sp.]|uniref:two-partner secretion domain-containing protein n=1 Tax=Marinospirillum sp. TaxID=2183934 RepID=UPI002B49492A|nr:filamentous hemagglutinin N-terminal domain-containing protein [Marinospirillum sp.]HKM15928.1 filamentous hemagglutinin N-terminal domain-containing protein [Marinospirillum sp.]
MNSNRSINHFYRVVGNIAAGVFVLLPLSAIASGLPTAGQVVAGSGSMSESGNTLTVTQTSATMVADWQSFSIGQGNTVNFIQPSISAVALNRVMGADVSVIQGALNANGQVFLVNPNGVLFTPTAQVNVGALVASSLELSTADFLAGNYRFSGNSAAGVINQGAITTTAGGTVALIAARIENTGSITAPEGNVLMGAGKKVYLDLGGPVKIEVEEGALNTLIEQGGGIYADGGLVYLTAKAAGNLASSVINHTGLTQARGITTNQQGEIYLMGDMVQGSVQVAGTLDAAAYAGKAGFIETSAYKVKVVDDVNIKASQWLIDPYDFIIADTSGDISGMALSTALNSTDVTIKTTDSGVNCIDAGVTCGSGNPSGNGDILVNDAITWSAATKLTLSAYRNIEINANITAQHAAGQLQLEYGQGSSEPASDPANYSFNGGTINLRAGNNFFTQSSSDSPISWWVITELGNTTDKDNSSNYTLQGLAHSSNLSGDYVLGADIDAVDTNTWNSSEGFTPIGNDSSQFRGRFDGLGHTISNLTINRPTEDHVGLFGFTEAARINNLGLVNVNIQGRNNVGGLVGWLQANEYNFSSINNSYVTGSVTAAANHVGGLVGLIKGNAGTAEVRSSYSEANVEGIDYIGGLVGKLEAKNYGTARIGNSYAAGDVKGVNSIGGLVGLLENGSTYSIDIFNSYAIGNLTGSNKGGLVGHLSNTVGIVSIENSFWDTSATGVSNDIGLLEDTGSINIVVDGITTDEMQNVETFISTWDIILDEGYAGSYLYPRLTMNGGLPIWVIKGNSNTIVLNYTPQSFTGLYNGEDYLLESVWNAEAIFGASYSGWELGKDYIFKYNGLPIDRFFAADSYTNISVEVLRSGFSASGSPSTFIINPRPITITVDSLTKSVGYADPMFTYKITQGSLVSGDSLGDEIINPDYYIPSSSGTTDKLTSQGGSISITDRNSVNSYSNLDLTRIEGEAVGDYAISADGFTNNNYSVTVNDGTLKIKPRPVVVNNYSQSSPLAYGLKSFDYLNMNIEQGGINLGGK